MISISVDCDANPYSKTRVRKRISYTCTYIRHILSIRWTSTRRFITELKWLSFSLHYKRLKTKPQKILITMKLFYILLIANQFIDSSAISMRSLSQNSRRRIPAWLEKGHFNGHFNNHRHKKSVKDYHSKVGILKRIEIFLVVILDWSHGILK